jgi:transposase InsO family protein
MSDVMDGPSLKNDSKGATQRTWLVATLDDHSRLSPHAQFYPHQKITALLDCLRQGFARRGLPEALYTDQGKIFTGSQLKIACANLGIRLLHALVPRLEYLPLTSTRLLGEHWLQWLK